MSQEAANTRKAGSCLHKTSEHFRSHTGSDAPSFGNASGLQRKCPDPSHPVRRRRRIHRPRNPAPDAMDDTVTLRFRVDNIYKNRSICVYSGDRRILQRKRPVLAPGEMEQVTLTKKQLADLRHDHITVTIEEG